MEVLYFFRGEFLFLQEFDSCLTAIGLKFEFYFFDFSPFLCGRAGFIFQDFAKLNHYLGQLSVKLHRKIINFID